MDQFDQAQALEARHREAALTAHRERAARPSLSHSRTAATRSPNCGASLHRAVPGASPANPATKNGAVNG